MFEPAERLKNVKVSASSAMTRKVRELRAQGVKIVGLSSGEPDFMSPRHAIEAGYKAALAGDTKYPPQDGTKALKEAVQRKFKRDNNLDYAIDEILVSNGSKQIMYNALLATVERRVQNALRRFGAHIRAVLEECGWKLAGKGNAAERLESIRRSKRRNGRRARDAGDFASFGIVAAFHGAAKDGRAFDGRVDHAGDFRIHAELASAGHQIVQIDNGHRLADVAVFSG